MVEIPLRTIADPDGFTGRLWEKVKKPKALQKSLQQRRYPREVEIQKTLFTQERPYGYVSVTLTPEGVYNVEIAFQENHEAEDKTYFEETLHLLQYLLNPIFFDESEVDAKVKHQLASLGLDTVPEGFAEMYSSSFLKNVERTLISFAESVGIDTLPEHFLTQRALLVRFFTGSLKSPGLRMDKSIIMKLAPIVKAWGIDVLSDEERKVFSDHKELAKNFVAQSRKLPNDAYDEREALHDAYLNDSLPFEEKMSAIFQQVALMLEALPDEKVELLFSHLGLQPLLTLENYTITRQLLEKYDHSQVKSCIVTYLHTADSIRLEKIHYILRPGGDASDKVTIIEWLNTVDDDQRRVQCMEMLEQYQGKNLSELFIQLIDEELSQLWVEGATEHAVLTHPMFWDVADSALLTNPQYIQLNTIAIQAALMSGDVTLPAILVQASQMKEKDFSFAPHEVVKAQDPHAGILVNRIQRERYNRMMTSFDTWQLLAQRVSKYTQAGIELLIQNPSVPSLNFVIERLVGISHLMQEYKSLIEMNNFLAELVAKSIKMYLLDAKEDLGDMYSGYDHLLVSRRPKVYTRNLRQGESIWNELVDCIINALKSTEDDGKLILRLIQAKDVNEVAEIVGYSF